MLVEFSRRLELMSPAFGLDDKPSSDTIMAFLNSYAQRFMKMNYIVDDQIPVGTRAQKRNDDILSGFLTRQRLPILAKDPNNSDAVTDRALLPDDYFMYVRSNSILSKNYKLEQEITVPANYITVVNHSIKQEQVDDIITTYFNNAILRNPYVVIDNTSAEVNTQHLNVIHDKYTIVQNIDLIYYRKPRTFNVIGVDNITVFDSTDYPESVHMEIVEGALEMFLTEAKFRLAQSNDNQ